MFLPAALGGWKRSSCDSVGAFGSAALGSIALWVALWQRGNVSTVASVALHCTVAPDVVCLSTVVPLCCGVVL